MAIRTVSGTETTRGSCTISLVEISESSTPNAYDVSGWEFSCAACDAHDVALSEDEARDELSSHTCPDVPPCSILDEEVPVMHAVDVKTDRL
jgi:hypothetical protein